MSCPGRGLCDVPHRFMKSHCEAQCVLSPSWQSCQWAKTFSVGGAEADWMWPSHGQDQSVSRSSQDQDWTGWSRLRSSLSQRLIAGFTNRRVFYRWTLCVYESISFYYRRFHLEAWKKNHLSDIFRPSCSCKKKKRQIVEKQIMIKPELPVSPPHESDHQIQRETATVS